MSVRTDLAAELSERAAGEKKGVREQKRRCGEVSVSEITVLSPEGEKTVSRPMGTYITVEFPGLTVMTDFSDLKQTLQEALTALVPENWRCLLVVGLGNMEITPDSVGPRTANRILATRHLAGEFAERAGLKGLKSVAVLSPGVLGKTGIEVAELTKGAAERIRPDAVIAIDALAAGSASRLFRTVQLCNTGISPGSGVKNSRRELSRKTVGVPVIAVGVPTVVDAGTLAMELTGREPERELEMIVTPKEADLLCEKISGLLSEVLNRFLQPALEDEVLFSLV